MTHSHAPEHPDGTGEDWAVEVSRDAVRAREAAEAGETVTWSHLLVEAVTAAIATGDATNLDKRLAAVDYVIVAWRLDLAYRRGDACCLPNCGDSETVDLRNSKLALN